MSWLSRLFGGKTDDAEVTGTDAPSEEYKGLRITPAPMKEGNVFRISAHISGAVDGTPRSHHMIRADTLSSREEAVTASIAKAKQMIDEQGMRVLE